MHTKQKFAYIVLGGVLVAAGMIISPLNAQKDKFGEIECTRLAVVDADGNERVILSTDPVDNLLLKSVGSGVAIYGAEHDSRVSAYGKGGKSASLNIREHGGYVAAQGKEGRSAVLSIGVFGGHVAANNKHGESKVSISIGPHGGHVVALGNETELTSWLGIGEHGGFVQVDGKGEGKAAIAVNELGNGAVSSYDKNGNRQ